MYRIKVYIPRSSAKCKKYQTEVVLSMERCLHNVKLRSRAKLNMFTTRLKHASEHNIKIMGKNTFQ